MYISFLLQERISEGIRLEEKEELQQFLKEGEDVNNHTEDQGTLQDMITLLRNWVFVMFAVSNFLTSLGYPIPYSFIPVSFPGRCTAEQDVICL